MFRSYFFLAIAEKGELADSLLPIASSLAWSAISRRSQKRSPALQQLPLRCGKRRLLYSEGQRFTRV